MMKVLTSNNTLKNFFLSNVIANIGISIATVGINWYIVDYSKQNKILGIYMAISVLSSLISSFFIGTLIDSYDRKYIMILSNVIQACILSILLLLFFLDKNILQIVYLLAIFNSIGLAIYTTASKSFIQELLENENLIYGNSVIEISLQIGAIVAAGITGIIYKYYGIKIILFIMIITLILSCIFLIKIKHPSITVNNENYLSKFIHGMEYISSNRIIFLFGILVFTPYIVTITSNSVLPGYIKEYLSLSSIEYGVSDMLFGIGAFISGLIISMINKNIKKNLSIILMFIISICSLIFLFFNNSTLGLYNAYFLFGLANTSIKIILNTILMEIVPVKLYGRVISFLTSISSIIQVVIILGLGYLMDNILVTYGYLVLSIIMCIGFYFTLKILPKLKISNSIYID